MLLAPHLICRLAALPYTGPWVGKDKPNVQQRVLFFQQNVLLPIGHNELTFGLDDNPVWEHEVWCVLRVPRRFYKGELDALVFSLNAQLVQLSLNLKFEAGTIARSQGALVVGPVRNLGSRQPVLHLRS